MTSQKLLLAIFILVMVSCSGGEELSQWRGPDRDGKYPQTGLLSQWPDEGPKMLWSFEGLGKGHGSVGIAEDRIFVLGMPDTIGVIYSFDMKGNLLWQKEYGLEWYANYTGTRSTPTIVDGLLYFVSGQGVAFCMETETGEVVWSVDGAEHNMVALDRFTAELIWTSKGNGEPSAYCSPILVQHNGTRLIITSTSESVVGIDADNGQTYWRIEHRQVNDIHANSPVYADGRVFSATDNADTLDGHLMIQLSQDGKTAKVGWRNQEWFSLMGAIILHEGYIYSSTFRKKEWYCIDAETGSLNYVSDQVSGGAIIFAEGLFYSYGTDGILTLVEADETSCRVISSFSIPLGTEQHWAHPVIHDGRIYVRHWDALMCYDIS